MFACQSYSKNKSGTVFFDSQCMYVVFSSRKYKGFSNSIFPKLVHLTSLMPKISQWFCLISLATWAAFPTEYMVRTFQHPMNLDSFGVAKHIPVFWVVVIIRPCTSFRLWSRDFIFSTRVVFDGGDGGHVPLTRLRRPPHWNWFSDPWVGCL